VNFSGEESEDFLQHWREILQSPFPTVLFAGASSPATLSATALRHANDLLTGNPVASRLKMSIKLQETAYKQRVELKNWSTANPRFLLSQLCYFAPTRDGADYAPHHLV
jgi:hypothetical protein